MIALIAAVAVLFGVIGGVVGIAIGMWVAGALGIVGAFILGLLVREVAEYLPSIGRWLIRRSVRGLPEPTRTELRESSGAGRLNEGPLGSRV